MIRPALRSWAVRGSLVAASVAALILPGCSDPISPMDRWPQVVVAGQVTRATGEPAPGVRVRVDLRAPGCADGLITFGSKTTDAEGRYAVSLEEPGRFDGCVRVRATASGADPVIAEQERVSLEPGRPPADTAWVNVTVP